MRKRTKRAPSRHRNGKRRSGRTRWSSARMRNWRMRRRVGGGVRGRGGEELGGGGAAAGGGGGGDGGERGITANEDGNVVFGSGYAKRWENCPVSGIGDKFVAYFKRVEQRMANPHPPPPTSAEQPSVWNWASLIRQGSFQARPA
ncbi:unnamed protein product [Nesidiocoris tenuis]|uniref:Uncharacterized protein n=1 Tax=Nesidiocoris tenuis TaxID=355587 RepID=A0A6H5GQL9_9HEMI|nr:unnamed protein product [Nesidiocoris tenuis]